MELACLVVSNASINQNRMSWSLNQETLDWDQHHPRFGAQLPRSYLAHQSKAIFVHVGEELSGYQEGVNTFKDTPDFDISNARQHLYHRFQESKR